MRDNLEDRFTVKDGLKAYAPVFVTMWATLIVGLFLVSFSFGGPAAFIPLYILISIGCAIPALLIVFLVVFGQGEEDTIPDIVTDIVREILEENEVGKKSIE